MIKFCYLHIQGVAGPDSHVTALPNDAEEYVHIHAGIHGIGDLDDAEYDWRNPAARIVIKRIVMAEEDEED